jgi:Cdc6-like AAA superfamily ATPase
MKNLYINATHSTPAVFFNINKGILTITGKSFPENSSMFFDDIDKALDEFIKEHSNVDLTITCEFEYINSLSNKAVFNILEKAAKSLNNVIVVWKYEENDEDMKEQGEFFETSFKTKIHFHYKHFLIQPE